MEVLREYMQKALEKGWIRPSKSPVGAPVLFILKKDSGYHLCMDYRGLNIITVKNTYLIVNMEQAINHLSSAKIYMQLDLRMRTTISALSVVINRRLYLRCTIATLNTK
jgi:hypothetical protein